MNGARALNIPSAGAAGENVPQAWLVDARFSGLDEPGLAAHARALSNTAGGCRYVSRSYRHPYALIASHDAPVGVDIERIEPRDPAFAETICTPTERAAGWPHEHADRYLSALWSSKEALAKALGDALAYDPRRLESPGAWPYGRSGPWRAAPLATAPGHVAWLCWRNAVTRERAQSPVR